MLFASALVCTFVFSTYTSHHDAAGRNGNQIERIATTNPVLREFYLIQKILHHTYVINRTLHHEASLDNQKAITPIISKYAFPHAIDGIVEQGVYLTTNGRTIKLLTRWGSFPIYTVLPRENDHALFLKRFFKHTNALFIGVDLHPDRTPLEYTLIETIIPDETPLNPVCLWLTAQQAKKAHATINRIFSLAWGFQEHESLIYQILQSDTYDTEPCVPLLPPTRIKKNYTQCRIEWNHLNKRIHL